jgi:hypothetical protein
MKPLTKSAQYKKFTADRNRALENILQKKLIALDNVMDAMRRQVMDYTAAVLLNRSVARPRTGKDFEAQVQQFADAAWQQTVLIAAQVRRIAYTLSYSGEVEAIARATQKPATAKLDRAAISKKMALPMPSGGDLTQRVKLSYDRLVRKILDAYQLSRVLNDEVRDAMQRVASAFPRQRTVIRPKKKLKAREAAPPRRLEDVLVSGFIDDDLWQEALDSYLSDAFAVGRGPDDITRVGIGKDKVERYTWEVEREITEDFVKLVREGQIDAAKDNDITDFVWISVVDDRTDECCLWRDGLTTKEIEAALKGERRSDECRTTTPPAHFNCRCDLAPMTKDIPATKPEPLGDFETWFTKK